MAERENCCGRWTGQHHINLYLHPWENEEEARAAAAVKIADKENYGNAN